MESEPQSKKFKMIMNDIETGKIKIPQFQRDFVWNVKKSARLMDSIVKGYPIGTLIFWNTKERLRAIKNIGDCDLPEPKQGEYINFVLDGQQRLTSLYASLKGLQLERDNDKIDDYSEIFVDLDADEDEQIVVVDTSDRNPNAIIKLTDLLYGKLSFFKNYPEEHFDRIGEIQERIKTYPYSVIQVEKAPIDIATEIFTRINVEGKPLTLFEIMVAKMFDMEKNFDLSENFNQLIERLKPVNYETISEAAILQTISLILEKECKRKVILRLNKQDFIDTWAPAVDAIKRAIEYFRGFYRIPVSQLLPYSTLLVPFAYFFYHHPEKPYGDMQRYLQDFFWRCSLSARYSSSVESKLAQDIKRIDQIIAHNLPKYDWTVDISPKYIIENGWFNAGRSYVKAILCIYAYHQPKSFNDDSIVNISNYWLKQANSKNYHHFFPRAFMKGKKEEEYVNHILNITIVDDFLNKNKIRAKAPSEYMKEFKEINSDLKETMKTHLIMDLDKFGVWKDDYNQFINERAIVVSKELENRIIRQEIDMNLKDIREIQATLVDDFEETEIE